MPMPAPSPSCSTVCASEHRRPDDCVGWYDGYACCIVEADKDDCRRQCECESKPHVLDVICTGASVIITIFDHEACIGKLFEGSTEE